MAFAIKRGRPRLPPRAEKDLGTPELQLKRALDITEEPLDLCLQRGIITPGQHRAGLHLRWLYTLRYGAPVLTTQYEAIASSQKTTTSDDAWRLFREHEYHEATHLLKHHRLYEPVMRICIYHHAPASLDRMKLHAAMGKPELLKRLLFTNKELSLGLDLLRTHWHFQNS